MSALGLSHVKYQPGRFPFVGRELGALRLPVSVLWAEQGPGDGRDHPTLNACRNLQRAIKGAVLCTVAKKPLKPPKIGVLPGASDEASEESSKDLFLRVGGWPSLKVYDTARGTKKYLGLAVAAVAAQDAGDHGKGGPVLINIS